jgi:hypothetical protein
MCYVNIFVFPNRLSKTGVKTGKALGLLDSQGFSPVEKPVESVEKPFP